MESPNCLPENRNDLRVVLFLASDAPIPKVVEDMHLNEDIRYMNGAQTLAQMR